MGKVQDEKTKLIYFLTVGVLPQLWNSKRI